MQARLAHRRPVQVLADHRLMGEAVAAALSSRGRPVSTVRWRYGPTRTGPETEPRGQHPEVVGPWSGVLVCDLEEPLSLAAARALVRRASPAWVVITSGSADARWGSLLEAGAAGVLPAGTSLEHLHGALESLEAGASVTDAHRRARALGRWSQVPRVDRDVLARLERLTPREREVLAGLSTGTPVAELARQLEISVATVRSQVRAVLRKLEVGTQIAAVAAVARVHGSDLFRT